MLSFAESKYFCKSLEFATKNMSTSHFDVRDRTKPVWFCMCLKLKSLFLTVVMCCMQGCARGAEWADVGLLVSTKATRSSSVCWNTLPNGGLSVLLCRQYSVAEQASLPDS